MGEDGEGGGESHEDGGGLDEVGEVGEVGRGREQVAKVEKASVIVWLFQIFQRGHSDTDKP